MDMKLWCIHGNEGFCRDCYTEQCIERVRMDRELHIDQDTSLKFWIIATMIVVAVLFMFGCGVTKTKTGNTGPQGSTGYQGEKGAPGEKGLIGNRGFSGSDGPRGSSGADGQDGERGAIGETGPAGSVGERGPRGPAGSGGSVEIPVMTICHITFKDNKKYCEELIDCLVTEVVLYHFGHTPDYAGECRMDCTRI